MKVICISGKAQHGKDTTANLLKEIYEEQGKRVLIFHYGDLVKYVCKTFFDWDGKKDDKGRSLLQYVGTDVIRTQKPNYWVNFGIDILNFFPNKWDYVLIPDCRFPNEYESCVDAGLDVVLLRVTRPGFDNGLTEEQQKHKSETALDGYSVDIHIENESTLEALKEKIVDAAMLIDRYDV